MRQYVVVPDGLDYPGGPDSKPQVSWVYQCVLDDLLERVQQEDVVILAPANTFGQSISEHEAAKNYLLQKRSGLKIICPPSYLGKYVDTWGNAVLLKDYLKENGRWPLVDAVLCVYVRHARRAAMLFAREGFKTSLHVVQARKNIVRRKPVLRLWYYNYPLLHRVYESLALLVFRLRKSYKK